MILLLSSFSFADETTEEVLGVPAAVPSQPVVVLAEGLDRAVLDERLSALGRDAEVLSFAAMMRRAFPEISKGGVTRCEQSLTLDEVERAVKRAEDAVLYNDLSAAKGHLETARNVLPCANDKVSAERASRVYYLSGFVAASAGEDAAAGTWFQRAHLFQPGLAWDERLDASKKALFEQAELDIYSVPPARVYVTPDPKGRWWVDGAAPEAEGDFFPIPVGDHLLQVGESPAATWTVRFESGETNLRLPSLAPADAASWADDPTRREELGAWLARAAPAGDEVLVCTPQSLWSTRAGSSEWTDLWAPIVADREAARARYQKRRTVGWGIAAGGGAAFGGGVVWAGLVTKQAFDKLEAAKNAENLADQEALAAEYDEIKDHRAGIVLLTAASGVVAGTGLFLAQYRGGAVQPTLVSSSPGLVWVGTLPAPR